MPYKQQGSSTTFEICGSIQLSQCLEGFCTSTRTSCQAQAHSSSGFYLQKKIPKIDWLSFCPKDSTDLLTLSTIYGFLKSKQLAKKSLELFLKVHLRRCLPEIQKVPVLTITVAWTFNGGKATRYLEWVSTARNQDVMQTMGPSWEFSFPSLDISTSGVRYQYVAKPSSKKTLSVHLRKSCQERVKSA